MVGKLIFQALPEVVWKMPTSSRRLYLTFDDGPDPACTPALLEILDHYQVPATFFLSGVHLEQYSAQLKFIRFNGHQLGSHGYDHYPLNLRSLRTIEAALLRTDQLIRQNFKVVPACFRPPYGIWGRKLTRVLHRLNKQMILWSLMGYEFKWEPQRVLSFLIENLEPGDVICLHDSVKTWKAVKQILPDFIEYCHKENYSFCPVSSNDPGHPS